MSATTEANAKPSAGANAEPTAGANAELSAGSGGGKKTRKITRSVLTKYEDARGLSVRAQQISNGAEPHVDPGTETDAFKIALLERAAGKRHVCSRRYLPSGQHEDYNIDDLENMEQQYLSATATELSDAD